jgi:hypothetical protein
MNALFSNLNLKPQNSTEKSQVQQEAPKKEEDPKDAWSLGKNLVNLSNLKESMSLNTSEQSTFASSQPVYIKASNEAVQPKFIPGVFMAPQ